MAINIELDDIRDKADSFRDESDNQETLISDCDSLLSEIMEVWEGEAAKAFEAQWEELKPSLQSAVELLESIGTQLDGVADTMEETDAQLADSMGV